MSKRAALFSCALWIASGCSEAPSAEPVAQRVEAATVDLWAQGAETAAPAPLPSSDVTHIFEYVDGSNSTSSTTFTGRTSGPSGASGVVHSGTWSVHIRGNGSHPNSSVPVYTGEVRKLLNTTGHTNVRLTYWRRLVGFEASMLNGVIGYDRFVVRYSTAASPGPSDWTEAHAITNGAGGVWTEGVVENLPAASTLWISFQADLRPRLNTSVTPSVYAFDEWIYLDDFRVTGDTGCANDAACDDGSACTTDTCNVGGVCSNAAIQCSDGLFCNGSETCNTSTGCVAGVAPAIDDGSACTNDSCDETNDVVVHAAVQCSDGLFCNGAETCNAATGCVAGTAPVIDDGSACTNDSCDETNDVVVHAAVQCNDGLFCNGLETCNAATGCVAGTEPSLDDGIGCTADSCDEATQAVVHTPNHAGCSDGAECTADSCSATADCVFEPTPGVSCGVNGICDAAGSCIPNPPGACDGLAEHDPCGQGASWCEDGECVLSAACGDGWLNKSGVNEPVEQCDDGNNLDGDACSSSCESTIVTSAGEFASVHPYAGPTQALGANGYGQMLLVWQAGGNRLLGRWITSTGLKATLHAEDDETFTIQSTQSAGNWIARPQVVGMPNGDFAVVYLQRRGGPLLDRIVYRIVARTGLVGAAVEVSRVNYEAGQFGAGLSNDRLLIVWQERLLSANAIHARLYGGGSTQGYIVASISSTVGNTEVALAADGSARFAVAWSDKLASTISLRTVIDSNGSVAFGAARVVATSATLPALAPLPQAPETHAFALAYTGVDGFARTVELDGDGIAGPPRRVTTSTTGDEQVANVAALGRGAYAVGFEHAATAGGGVRLLLRGGSEPGDEPSDDPALLEALAGLASFARMSMISIDRGVWVTWTTENGGPLSAYLLDAPEFQFDGAFDCFNRVDQLASLSGSPYFAAAVAAGDRVLVSQSPGYGVPPAPHGGLVDVYKREGGSWSLEQRLQSADPDFDAAGHFGTDVAFDGTTAVIGAPADGLGDTGVAYIYERSGETWAPTAIPNPDPLNLTFPAAVAVSGEHVLLSGNRDVGQSAVVYVYRRTELGWVFGHTLEVPPGASRMAWSLSMDGDTALVGYNDGVHVFRLIADEWQLVHSDTSYEAVNALTLRGDTALISSTGVPHLILDVVRMQPDGSFTLENTFRTDPPHLAFGVGQVLGDDFALLQDSPPQILRRGSDDIWTLSDYLDGAYVGGYQEAPFALGNDFLGVVEYPNGSESKFAVLSCQAYHACGDSWIEAGEACDDGNSVAGDGCENDCSASCAPTSASDASCDGLDDDCDQNIDENFSSSATSCGLGVCASSGSLTCNAGTPNNSCVPGTPTSPTDATCNAIDEDCSGAADDDFVTSSTSCGIGACANNGSLTCNAGSTNDSCTPLAPLGVDSTCNAVDDDCDAHIDESYAPSSTSCGVGACAAGGQLTCTSGTETNTCTPLPPLSATDATCNGVDDDCDGNVDENCACTQATATVAAHVTASRAFACSSTPVSFFSEGFESGTLNGWTAVGNVSASTALAQAGSYSAQLAGTGLSTLRRTISTAGLSTATLSVQVRTRGALSAGYNPAVRHSINGGSTWTQLASHPGPLPSWGALTFNTLPINSSLTLSFEASPTETTRFVHFDTISVTGTCSTPAWFAQGSNAQLGTSSGASVTLYNLHAEPGVWRSGTCPVLP